MRQSAAHKPPTVCNYVIMSRCGHVTHLLDTQSSPRFFFFSSIGLHTRWTGDWSSDVCSSDLARIVVEAEDAMGRVVASRLTTPEAYTLTAETATAIVKRVVSGDVEPGFQTPARLFGPGFILGFAGVSRVDLETNS